MAHRGGASTRIVSMINASVGLELVLVVVVAIMMRRVSPRTRTPVPATP